MIESAYKIKYIISDIDGVLTDGRFVMDENGNESKQLCYRDLDAIGIGRISGIEFFFITGESGKMVETISKRFNVADVVQDAPDKLLAIKKLCKDKDMDPKDVCYIGDADRDVAAIIFVGLGVVPFDGSKKAITVANYVTSAKGGFGVLFEVVSKLVDDINK